MRVIALDIGEKRIGVALSDPLEILASPLTTINHTSESEDIDAVLRLVDEHDAAAIVVGLPLSLSGQMGAQARRVARFARSLTARSSVPVHLLDERFTTVQAERMMKEAGKRPSRDRARVDAAAAAVLLQSYLDGGKTTGNRGCRRRP